MEFRCEHCGQLLMIADETVAESVQCPACQKQCNLTRNTGSQGTPSQNPFSDPPAVASENSRTDSPEPGEKINPYASPATVPGFETSPAYEKGEIRRTIIDVNDVLGRSWRAFKNQMGIAIGVFLLVTIINNLIGQTTGFVLEKLTENLGVAGLLVGYSLVLAGIALQTYFNIGQIIIMLQIARGQRASFNSLFSGEKLVLPVFGASILYFLIVLLGLLLLIIPGIILALMYCQFYYLIIDRKSAIMQSFSQSQNLMQGNKLNVFLLGIVCSLLTILGLLLCLVGFFFTGALSSVIVAMTYLRITGQPCVE